MLNKIFRYSFYVCIIAVEYLATTTKDIQIIQHSWDKANHFMAFMVLFVLLSFGYRHLSMTKRVFILLLIAVEIEIVQYFIPTRSCSLLDIFADMVGIGAGYIAVRYLKIHSLKL